MPLPRGKHRATPWPRVSRTSTQRSRNPRCHFSCFPWLSVSAVAVPDFLCRPSHECSYSHNKRKQKKKKQDVQKYYYAQLNKVFSQPSSPFDIIITTTAHHGFHLPPPQQPPIDQSTVRPSTHSLEKVALYHAVVECERNSLVYLPRSRGLGRTLVVGMVMRRLLDLNPQRQAFFLVEMDAQVSVRVRTTSSSSPFFAVVVVVVFALKTLPICLSSTSFCPDLSVQVTTHDAFDSRDHRRNSPRKRYASTEIKRTRGARQSEKNQRAEKLRKGTRRRLPSCRARGGGGACVAWLYGRRPPIGSDRRLGVRGGKGSRPTTHTLLRSIYLPCMFVFSVYWRGVAHTLLWHDVSTEGLEFGTHLSASNCRTYLYVSCLVLCLERSRSDVVFPHQSRHVINFSEPTFVLIPLPLPHPHRWSKKVPPSRKGSHPTV